MPFQQKLRKISTIFLASKGENVKFRNIYHCFFSLVIDKFLNNFLLFFKEFYLMWERPNSVFEPSVPQMC